MTEDHARRIIAGILAEMSLAEDDTRLYLRSEVLGEFLCRALKIANPGREVEQSGPCEIKILGNGNDDCPPLGLSFERAMRRFSPVDLAGNFDILVRTLARLQSAIETVAVGEALDLSRVVPLLKSTAMLSRSQARNEALAAKDGGDPVPGRYASWDVSEGLAALLAINQTERFHFVTAAMLAEHNATFDELKSSAMANLAKSYNEAKIATDYADGMAEITDTGWAAASLILLDGFLEQETMRAADSVLHIFSSGVDHLVLMPGSNTTGVASVLTGLRTGSLPWGDIPPLVYEAGKLRVFSAHDLSKIAFSLIGDGEQQPAAPSPKYH
ncbi:hypothetical protein HFN89_06735 [Rhizobium laguerreae]|nr:hypothetical protein [Rhizobium laguerreae]